MTDRPRGIVRVTSTRIGRTDLGPGSAIVEDDALVIAVPGSAGERPIRVPFTSVDAVGLERESSELTLALRDGTRLLLASPGSISLHDDLLSRCRALPELTRALRTFGSRRGHRTTRVTAGADQQRFFAPLLQARKSAGTAASPAAVIGAFDALALSAAYGQTLEAFVAERLATAGPARRALEAELTDLAEPLMNALSALGAAASTAAASIDDLRLWREWSAELRATFEAADKVWISLDVALDAAPGQS